MNVIYKVKRSGGVHIPPNDCCTMCKLSSKNIVAVCVVNKIENDSNLTFRSQVQVSDLLSPWNTYTVCTTHGFIHVLEWDHTGELLLVAEDGIIKLWKCNNHVLNSWSPAFVVNFKGEQIINCKFFHNGKRINFNSQKRDSTLYAEKFERVNYTPTLQQFGKAAAEGCIALTASGLLGAFLIPHARIKVSEDFQPSAASLELPMVTQSLGLARNYIRCSAFSYCSNGGLRIATTGGPQDTVVHCFNITVKCDNGGNLIVNRESLPSIFLGSRYQTLDKNFRITHIKWTTTDTEELVLIAYNFEHNSILEQWNLITKQKSIHKFLQKNKAEIFHNEYWENVARYHLQTKLEDICLSKNFLDSYFIFILLRDNTVQILETGLKKAGIMNMTKFLEERHHHLAFKVLDISIMNHVLILLDNLGQMYAVQICNRYMDLKQNEMLVMQMSLLEYCIVTGFDACGILLLHLNNLECLTEKITENFMRQPPFIRQYYYSNFLALKSNMYRLYSKQNDFDNLIMLHSISIAFKSLLRPSDLVCYDKGPADNLAIVLSDALPDVDKVLFNLDAKDFTVEPLTLQSLQQLIQWVADLSLNILHRLPEDVVKSKFCKKQCYELSRDTVALTSIRELLAMIRIWGLLNSQCLPVYIKSIENVDVLSVLFRLLTRLAQNPIEPDDMLLDECVILSTQVLIPNYNFFNHVSLLSSYMVPIKSFPIIFTAASEPTKQAHEIPIERVIYSSGIKDGISNILLGSNPKKFKECIRCGSFNGINNIVRTSAMKAWCHRWIHCRCGGHWVHH